ncbi:MAG: dTDP-4-dehydrorhamnose 3,5-epimerase [Sediminibacterium sp.]
MKIEETEIQGCYTIQPTIVQDERGWFMRTFCEEQFAEIGKEIHFTQMNHSFNYKKGTFRGMHYQTPPFAEEKLIRCISGAVIDYVLDLRKNSATYLKYIALELSATNRTMIFLPKGVAHGFQTLQDNTELVYHHTVSYNKDFDGGLRFDDPKINITLTLPLSIISDKDKSYELISNEFTGIEV